MKKYKVSNETETNRTANDKGVGSTGLLYYFVRKAKRFLFQTRYLIIYGKLEKKFGATNKERLFGNLRIAKNYTKGLTIENLDFNKEQIEKYVSWALSFESLPFED